MNRAEVKKWSIKNSTYDPESVQFFQNLFSQGNGYMGVCGYDPHSPKQNTFGKNVFLAGFFEYIKPGITDMVNMPDFFSTKISIDDKILDYSSCAIEDYCRELNMANGAFFGKTVYQHVNGDRTEVEFERFISMDNIHTAALRYKITPLNYSKTLQVETGIDADVSNNPISDNQLSDNNDSLNMWRQNEVKSSGEKGYIMLETLVSQRKIAIAYTLQLHGFGEVSVVAAEKNKYTGAIINTTINQGNTYIIDKLISFYSYRDVMAGTVEKSAIMLAETNKIYGYEELLNKTALAWQKKWDDADIQITASDEMQGAVRYNIFQLIQTNAENDPDVSIGARGIMHGRYKGCYFWDTEIFMLPFFLYTNPKAAKNLLMYRINTLSDAMQNAKWHSLKGARYSWMCSDKGDEQCETWDTGCCEVHITADIAYAIDNYAKVVGDSRFIAEYGAEVLIETARYWISRFTYDAKEDVYNMLFVKGPDEYCGVTINNTYTNYMAINNIHCAIKAVDLLKRDYIELYENLCTKIKFDCAEIAEWQQVIKKVRINYDSKTDLYIQDDLFMKLEPLDIELYKTDNTPLYHKISFDRLQRYRVLKQSDVILLMSLFPDSFTENQKHVAWNFYEPLTLHDSTLSFGTHALMASCLKYADKAQMYFQKSLFLDLYDVMGNTNKEGIHTASLGSTWQAIVFGFCGLSHDENGLKVTPNLPDCISSIKFKASFKGSKYDISVNGDTATIDKL